MVDPFVEETGAQVIVEYGFTSGSIAKVRAQAADPQLDVVLMDDIGVLTVVPENLLQSLDLAKIPNAANVDERFIVADGKGIGFFTYVDTLLYNTAAPIHRRQQRGGISGRRTCVTRRRCRRRTRRRHCTW